MQCPCCYSTQTFKNGFRQGRQCYKCKQCGRQFLESYQAQAIVSPDAS
ncbi:IS1/IS1595 family N-terminal zinc-binding domain-containing protein [Nostoc sp.]